MESTTAKSVTNSATTATYPTCTSVDQNTDKLAYFPDFDDLEFDLHTPLVASVESDPISSMWQRMEDVECAEKVALVAEAGEKDRGIGMVASLDELVDLLDLPGSGFSQQDGRADDSHYTNHCTTFGTEDMWPI